MSSAVTFRRNQLWCQLPTIVGDSIVIIEEAQITTTAYTETTTYTLSLFELGAAYFFDDNYFIGVGLNSVRMSNEYSNTLDATLDSEDENSALGFSIGLGKFIPSVTTGTSRQT